MTSPATPHRTPQSAALSSRTLQQAPVRYSSRVCHTAMPDAVPPAAQPPPRSAANVFDSARRGEGAAPQVFFHGDVPSSVAAERCRWQRQRKARRATDAVAHAEVQAPQAGTAAEDSSATPAAIM